jgi:type II secretory pathway component GspD/PulD (secretin)
MIGGGLAAALLFTLACRHTIPPGTTGTSLRAEADAARRIDRAYNLLERGFLADAEATIAPLAATGQRPVEVAQIQEEIARRRADEASFVPKELTDGRALHEVEKRLRLPENYGRTVIISPSEDPLELPPGPMEKLVNRRVTMELDNAPVSMILLALNEIDGLNLIADQALTEGAGGPALTVRVKDVPLRDVLAYIARNMGIAFHLSENVIWVTAADTPSGSGPQLETRFYRLRRGFVPQLGGDSADEELQEALDTFMTDSPQGASYRIFRHRNLLVVRDTREHQRQIEAFLREFDREPPQVLIEARFLLISQDAMREIGTTINEIKTTKDEGVESAITSAVASTSFPFSEAISGKLTLAGILGGNEYEVVMQIIEKTGKANTLSAPRVTVLNNQTASIRRGRTIRYYEEYDVATVQNEAGLDQLQPVPTGDVQELEIGISLEVRPNIGNDLRRILLALNAELSDSDGFETFITAKLPKTSENQISTTVAVESGQTVVLGGMAAQSVKQNVEKIPLLGDLPLIGFLFRHTTDSVEPQHYLIFVTAQIVQPSGEFVEVRDAAN